MQFANQPNVVGQAHVLDAVDDLLGSLQHAVERIDSAGYRIARIADRFFGHSPTPIPGPQKTAPVNPTVTMLLGDLGTSVERLFTELDRLQSK